MSINPTNYWPDGSGLCGNQSIFHPLNQFKGIGVCFKEIEVNFVKYAYPTVVFTKVNGLKDILNALGL